MLAVLATEGRRSEIYGYKRVGALGVGARGAGGRAGRAAEDEKREVGRG